MKYLRDILKVRVAIRNIFRTATLGGLRATHKVNIPIVIYSKVLAKPIIL